MKNRIQGMVIGFLAALIFGSLIVPALAAATYRQITVMYDDIKVVANGKLIDESVAGIPINPFMYNGVTYVPARAIGEALCGGVTSWDDSAKTLYLGSAVPNKTYKLNEVESSDEYFIRYENESRDSTDTFRKDCLLMGYGNGNYYIDYSLKGQFSRLEGQLFLLYIAIDYPYSCDLKIWGDGKLLYTLEGISKEILKTQPTLRLDTSGVNTLRIGVENVNADTYDFWFGLADIKLYP